MDVDLNLYFKGAAQKFGKAHFSDVGDFEELLKDVYNTVSAEYASSATIRINNPDMYELDGATIPEGTALPKPESGNPYIDVFFEQGTEKTPDSANIVHQIDELFGECKHYTLMKSIIQKDKA